MAKKLKLREAVLTPEEQQLLALKKEMFFEPCVTKDELKEFLKIFLRLDFPDFKLDEMSTSTPMDFVWEVYNTMRTNAPPYRHIAAASRGSAKTLVAATIEFLAMIHFRRDIVHTSALKAQSKKALKYFHKFCNIDVLKPYFTTESALEVELINLPPNSFTTKNDARLVTVAATISAANGERSNCVEGNSLIPVLRNGIYQVMTAHALFYAIEKKEEIYLKTVNEATLEIEYRLCQAAKQTWVSGNVTAMQCKKTKLTLKVTNDHPVAQLNSGNLAFKKAGSLLVDDKAVLGIADSILETDIATSTSPYFGYVYDFQVKNNHNFFANGFLVHNCLIFDELDLVDREVISEAAMMQTPTLCGNMHEPVSVYLSSRKTNDGPVQDLIDEAEAGSKKLRLHKYSTVDWMRKCPESVHGASGVKAWIHKDNLRIVWDALPETEPQSSYIERAVYEGCRTCPAMAVCQGRSAKQQSTSKFLKSREFVESQLLEVKEPGKIIAQILNWKPESTGTVFSTFSRFTHCKTPEQSWEFITGTPWHNPGNPPSKENLYNAGKRMGYDCVFGIDFGFSPDPAVVVVILHHRKLEKTVIIHIRSANYYSNSDWAASVGAHEAKTFPPDIICPDMADPAAHTYFAKLRLPARNKKPMRIETGVSQIRSLLFDPLTQTSKFAIAMFDEQSEWAAQSFMKWRHKTSVTGAVDPHGFEDSEWTHVLDATRYGLDLFIKSVKTSFSTSQKPQEAPRTPLPAQINSLEEYQKAYQKHMQDEFGLNINVNTQELPQAVALNQDFIDNAKKNKASTGQSGKFSFKF